MPQAFVAGSDPELSETGDAAGPDAPVVKAHIIAPPLAPQQQNSQGFLCKTASPAKLVTMKQLDAALVNYVGSGNEAVARMVGARLALQSFVTRPS